MEVDATRKVYLGSRITRLVTDEAGKFYDKKDETMQRPLRVTPMKDGLDTFSVFRYEQECGPTREDEINYELAGLALRLATEQQILTEQIGVRTNERLDTVAIDLYRISILE